MNKEIGKDLYSEGIECGKSLAMEFIFSYLQREGLELWLTGFKNIGGLRLLTPLRVVSMERFAQICREHGFPAEV